MSTVGRISFTGPTSLTLDQRVFVVETLFGLHADEFTTGGARGLDVLAAEVCLFTFPDALHRVVAPDRPYDDQKVAWLVGEGVELERMPKGTSYRDRNERLVDYADGEDDRFIGFVARPTFYRSGEWMTLNIARRRGLDPEVVVLP